MNASKTQFYALAVNFLKQMTRGVTDKFAPQALRQHFIRLKLTKLRYRFFLISSPWRSVEIGIYALTVVTTLEWPMFCENALKDSTVR